MARGTRPGESGPLESDELQLRIPSLLFMEKPPPLPFDTATGAPFWGLSSEWIGPAVAAAGVAQINALGNLSGFFFNYMIGWIKDETGSFPLAMMPIAVVATLGVICLLTIG